MRHTHAPFPKSLFCNDPVNPDHLVSNRVKQLLVGRPMDRLPECGANAFLRGTGMRSGWTEFLPIRLPIHVAELASVKAGPTKTPARRLNLSERVVVIPLDKARTECEEAPAPGSADPALALLSRALLFGVTGAQATGATDDPS